MTSILKCTLKKSLDVTKKLVLYAAIVIDALAALWLAGYGVIGLTTVLAAPIAAIITAMWFAIGIVIAFLFAIPWYVYAGLLVVAGIVGYSFAWCAKKELIPEDYTSDTASLVTIIQSFTSLELGCICIAFGYIIGSLYISIVLWVLGVAMVAASVFSFVNIPSGCFKDWSYYSFRFVGAVVTHYRKRVRGEV